MSTNFSTVHFAEGRFRRAYKGTYTAPPSKCGQMAVVKENKDTYMWNSTDWNTCLKMAEEAQTLADGFNEFSRTTHPLQFTDVTVSKVVKNDNPQSTPKLNEFVVVEDYIPGSFSKWCNNYGYIVDNESGKYLSAFMHWSWVNSSGQKMISDLQGVCKNNPGSFTLTDPAMLSVGGEYGATDTNVEGIAMFFLHHVCNDFCKSLRKPKVSDFIGVIPQRELSATMQLLQQVGNATTYTHELKFSKEVRHRIGTVFSRVACGY